MYDFQTNEDWFFKVEQWFKVTGDCRTYAVVAETSEKHEKNISKIKKMLKSSRPTHTWNIFHRLYKILYLLVFISPRYLSMYIEM